MTAHRSPVAALAVVAALILSACSDPAQPAATPSGSEASPEETTSMPAADTATTTVPQSADAAATPSTAAGPHQALLAEALGKRDGGIVALSVRDGETTSSAVGLANADGEPITTGHQFRVGSISKPFVAVMILQLVEEGELGLDAPLGAYLDETPVGYDVTVGQLLSHRSGIANYTDLPSFAQVINDPEAPTTPSAVVDLAAAVESDIAGGEFSYSNTNYILLGQLLEAIDGKSLDESLRARITEPLGLTETYFAGPDGAESTLLAEPWSLGRYAGKKDSPYLAWETAAWSAGALVSTPDELASFLQSLAAGELLLDETLAAMTDFTERPDYSFGLGDAPLGDNNPGWGHGGGIPGFLSFMAHAPESGDTVVVLTNNDSIDPNPIVEQLVNDWG